MAGLADILDPTGGVQTAVGTDARGVLAARAGSLAGLRVGLLENTKHNAALLLEELAGHLEREHGARAQLRRTKRNFAQPLADDVREEFVANCDVVLVGVGDCGSCSASAVADGIAFERAGVPAAVICSDAFGVTATSMAQVQGVPDYAFLTTPHPVAVLGPDAVAERATTLVPGVVATLTGRPPA